jgi:PAS domain S-box-containing protein
LLHIDTRAFFEDNPNPVLVLDGETRRVLAANEQACRHFGYSREELVGRDAALLRPDAEVEAMCQTYQATQAPDRPRGPTHSSRRWRHVKKDGSIAHVEIWRLLIRYEGRPAVMAVIHDVTDHANFERALRESEERYRRLFEAAPLPVFVFDVETGVYLAANEAAVRKYGWSREELLRMTVFDIRPPEDVPRLRETFARLDAESPEYAGLWRHKGRDGRTIDVEITTQAIEFAGRRARLAIVNDVTERRRLEEQLRQSYKMEATGLLAGAVAHDFNNLLGIVLGAVELAQRASAAGPPFALLLGEIHEAATRAGLLTRKLLAFSRKQVLHVRPLDLGQAVDDFLPILRRIFDEAVRLVVRRAAEPLVVRADASQLEQVLLNVSKNARQATPPGGQVTIETVRTRVDADQVRLEPWAKIGDYAEVRVADTGCGMDANTRERMFEPFFTTKSEGTGLGLAIVHGIVHQHQGLLHVESDPGRGTLVRVLLPLVEHVAAETPPRRMTPSGAPRAGGETVLVAEDEPALRRMIATTLEELGYEVVTAKDGAEAVSLFEKRQGHIAMAILDVVMPVSGGAQAYERMRALDPALKVIFMTGYAPESAEVGAIVARGGHAVLTKPFSIHELARRVRAALDAESDGVT